MMADLTSADADPSARPVPTSLRKALRAMMRPSAAIGGAVVVFWMMVAILAPLIAPFSPNDLVGRALQPPSSEFLLGTDDLGRDILSRVIWGARIVLVLAPIAVLIAETLGALIGLLSGYVGGMVDEVIMRINDALI